MSTCGPPRLEEGALRAAEHERTCTAHPHGDLPAEIPDGNDYAQTWAGLVADRAWYDDYQAKTSRRIPLVRLPETRPA